MVGVKPVGDDANVAPDMTPVADVPEDEETDPPGALGSWVMITTGAELDELRDASEVMVETEIMRTEPLDTDAVAWVLRDASEVVVESEIMRTEPPGTDVVAWELIVAVSPEPPDPTLETEEPAV